MYELGTRGLYRPLAEELLFENCQDLERPGGPPRTQSGIHPWCGLPDTIDPRWQWHMTRQQLLDSIAGSDVGLSLPRYNPDREDDYIVVKRGLAAGIRADLVMETARRSEDEAVQRRINATAQRATAERDRRLATAGPTQRIAPRQYEPQPEEFRTGINAAGEQTPRITLEGVNLLGFQAWPDGT